MKLSVALLSGAAIAALQVSPAFAQAGSPTPAQDSASSEEPVAQDIIVTGSHVARDGSEAPTPVSVIGNDLMEAAPRTNLTDTINLLPQFVNSQTSSIAATGPTNLQGQNLVNLRNLGPNRTLVLIDGHRAPITNLDGSVDLNVNLPQQLVSRTEIVTGGASAVYGSDAVAGVVNFILDDDYTGIKGMAEQGITTYGDDPSFKAGLTVGQSFAGGRGHVLLSGEYSWEKGVRGVPRDWNDGGWRLITNPAYASGNGQPQYLIQDKVGLQLMTGGGIITSGPLRGTAFGQGGVPYQFDYGTPAGALSMIGGEWATNNLNYTQQLWAGSRRKNAFGRVSYDLTDAINVYAQFGYSDSRTQVEQTQQFNLGNIVVHDDNAYLPDSVKARMADLGLTSFTLGTFNSDLPPTEGINRNQVYNYAAGVTGKFAGSCNWSLYAAYGKTVSDTKEISSLNSNFNMAIDAVRDGSGQIVCRSSLTDPNNGCVPYAILGIGVNTPEQVDYVMSYAPLHQVLKDRMVSADVHGDLFSTWAGAVAVAAGASYRKTSVTGRSDDISLAGGYFAANYIPTSGAYDVTEGYLEASVPLAKDAAWADSLELNGAVRATDYSTAGYVTTWKLGATYKLGPVGLRGNISRDIRAPSLGELFTPGNTGFTTVTDPTTGTTVVPRYLQTGNPDLKPEKSDSWGAGIIFSPDFLRGFTASVDYYDIKINDAISTVSNQQIVNRCFTGSAAFCSLVERDASGTLVRILTPPVNFLQLKERGLDFELGYRMPLGNGTLSLRGFATHLLTFEQNDGVTESINAAGSISAPSWRYLAAVTYDNDLFTASLVGRGLSATTYNNTSTAYVACTSGCPASTVTRPTINTNHIDGATYLDASLAFHIQDFGGKFEPYLAVQNILNKDPAINAGSLFEGRAAQSNQFDLLGRVFRVGVRFAF